MSRETSFTDALGLDVPIVQAPIGSATCPALAAAVADAGALGMLAVTWRDEAATREAVAETRRRTDGVFGVNVVLDPAAKDVPTETHVEACLDAGVDVFSFSFGDAAPYVDQVHDHGGVVLQSVGSAETAKRAVDAGVDVVVAQGWEAGGHVQGDVATLPLVPRVVDAVPETPVVAAGGIADGRGIAATLALGADGAWLGTRFLATERPPSIGCTAGESSRPRRRRRSTRRCSTRGGREFPTASCGTRPSSRGRRRAVRTATGRGTARSSRRPRTGRRSGATRTRSRSRG